MTVGADEFALFVFLEVVFRVVGFLVNAVPAFIGALVEVALLVQISPELLHRARLALFGGTHEVRVGDIEHIPGVFECGNHGIAPLLRRHAVLFARLGNLLAVLVKTGDECNVAAVHALITRHGVGGDGGVCSAQVGRRIYIVNRRGERIGGL